MEMMVRSELSEQILLENDALEEWFQFIFISSRGTVCEASLQLVGQLEGNIIVFC